MAGVEGVTSSSASRWYSRNKLRSRIILAFEHALQCSAWHHNPLSKSDRRNLASARCLVSHRATDSQDCSGLVQSVGCSFLVLFLIVVHSFLASGTLYLHNVLYDATIL